MSSRSGGSRRSNCNSAAGGVTVRRHCGVDLDRRWPKRNLVMGRRRKKRRAHTQTYTHTQTHDTHTHTRRHTTHTHTHIHTHYTHTSTHTPYHEV